jgi:hypothetical protein
MTSMPTVNRSNDPFEFEKKARKGKKFEKKETKGEKFRKDIFKEIELRKKKDKPRKPGEDKEMQPPFRKPGEDKEMQPLSRGGRAGYKAGSKGCKLAMKGKGRAYGKNS